MELQHEQQATEDLKAEGRIWNYMYGFVESSALQCAIELGIAEMINDRDDKTITLSQLADVIPVPDLNKERLCQIMRFMIHMQLFTVEEAGDDEEERYGLTSASKLLLKENQKNMCLVTNLFNELQKSLGLLSSGLEGNGTVFEKLSGMTYWKFLTANPERYKAFDTAMAWGTKKFMPVMIRGCEDVFKGIGSLVDVGGGVGAAITEIAKAFPHIK